MNSRFVIIAILISIKVIGIASRAKAEINISDLMLNSVSTCQGLPCGTTWDSIKNSSSKSDYYNFDAFICNDDRYGCGVIIR